MAERETKRRNYTRRLIRIAIIGVISTGLFLLLRPRYHSGFDDKFYKAHSDVAGLNLELETFRNDTGRYPTTAEGLNALVNNPGNLPGWKRQFFFDSAPVDPWGHPFIYRQPGDNGNAYDLRSAGEDGVAGTADDIVADVSASE